MKRKKNEFFLFFKSFLMDSLATRFLSVELNRQKALNDELTAKVEFLEEKINILKRVQEQPSQLFDLLVAAEEKEVKEEVKRRKFVCEWYDQSGAFCSEWACNLLPRPQIIVCEKHLEQFFTLAKKAKESV
ncbi:MAG: hypothetical protein K2Q45_06710 [Nitrosomonas sp.]|nr:hypothetical protein [Nitrosomonas sp.]